MARNRLFDDDVLVIGLGRFGSAVALELTKLGHRVIAVERNSTLAETYVNKVYRVVHADMAKSAALEMIRAAAPKIAIVGIGSSIESSVLAAANLVDAEVPSIWAKALTPEHKRILTRIGVHHVISPEADSGRRVAHLVAGLGLRLVAVTGAKHPADGPVVGVKAPGEDFTYAVPQTKISSHHMLIVSGPTELIERFAARP